MTADTEPLEILLHLPLLCEEKVRFFSALIDAYRRRFPCRTCRTYSSSRRQLLDAHVESLGQSLLRALPQMSSESYRVRFRRSKKRLTSSWYKTTSSVSISQYSATYSFELNFRGFPLPALSGVEAHENAITPANGYKDSVLITRNGHGPTDRPKNMWGELLWLLWNILTGLLSNPTPNIGGLHQRALNLD